MVALAVLQTDPLDPGGEPRRLDVGAAADLFLLDRPLAPALADLLAVAVRCTVVDGRVVFGG